MFFLKELPSRHILDRYQQRFPTMNVEAVEQALHLMRKASLLLRELEAYFVGHGLSQIRFWILIVLDREARSEGLRVSELAERIDVSRPVMTRTLQALQRDGLVRIAEHDSDGRAKCVLLAPRGSQALTRLLPGYYALIAQFMDQHGGEPC